MRHVRVRELRRAGRAEPPDDPGRAPGRRAAGGRPGRAPPAQPARRVEAPAGAAGGGAGGGAERRPAPALPHPAGTAGRDRRLARALPAPVEPVARRPGPPPGGGTMTKEGTLVHIEGRPALRFERRYAHPLERVWRAVTDPAEMAAWFPSNVEGERAVGAELVFADEEQRARATEAGEPTREEGPALR